MTPLTSSATMSANASRLLRFLLLLEFLSLSLLFPYYAFFMQETLWLRFVAVGLALLGLFTLAGVWTHQAWSPWAVLSLISCKLTIDLFAWAMGLVPGLVPFSWLINGIIVGLIFRQDSPVQPEVTRLQKGFFGFVMLLAALVGIWGLFLPVQVDAILPFLVPPLHARFLGGMYLSGATFMILGIAATRWAEVRVMVPMIAIWTGMLGLVSLVHLSAFDWDLPQVWIWFVAYSGYPIIAAWIAWQQRSLQETAAGPALSLALRWYLRLQGAGVTLLAGLLLVAPALMTRLWPWEITPLLAQIYSAPFFSYGLGSLYAARQHTWAEVRILVQATLVFTLTVFIASLMHLDLFTPGALATWLWFSGVGLATLALGVFSLGPAWRSR